MIYLLLSTEYMRYRVSKYYQKLMVLYGGSVPSFGNRLKLMNGANNNNLHIPTSKVYTSSFVYTLDLCTSLNPAAHVGYIVWKVSLVEDHGVLKDMHIHDISTFVLHTPKIHLYSCCSLGLLMMFAYLLLNKKTRKLDF